MDEIMNEGMINELKIVMNWYRTGDYTGMREELREEHINLYVNDDKKLNEDLKEQLAFNIQMIALAYQDKRLVDMSMDAHLAEGKEELRDIIISLREILKEPAFND